MDTDAHGSTPIARQGDLSECGGRLLLRRSRPTPLCSAIFFTTKITKITKKGRPLIARTAIFRSAAAVSCAAGAD